MTSVIRIVLCDDHPSLIEGMARIIDVQSDMQVIGTAANGDELLKRVAELKPDLVVVDVSMPGLHGFDLIRRLQADFAKVRIIVFSASPEEQYAVRFLRSGAHAYLSKSRQSTELLVAIRKVASGAPYLTDAASIGLLKQSGSNPLEALSDREMDVLRALIAGLSPSDISRTLNIGRSTVSTHLTNIRGKLSAQTNTQVVQLVVEQQLL